MSYFLEGLQVLGGMCLFCVFVLGVAIVMASIPHRHRARRVWRDPLPQDRSVRLVNGPFDQDQDVRWDHEEWERKYAERRKVR